MNDLYYEKKAREFFTRTAFLDLTPLYKTFLALIPKGGHILDAGCGSGRDALEFKKMGYEVTAMDASEKMVELAREYTGMQVVQMGFEEIEYASEFNGIWACASLLHLKREILFSNKDSVPQRGIFLRLIRALKDDGVMYMSFKKGAGERYDDDGRLFLDFTEEELQNVLDDYDGIKTISTWETESSEDKQLWTNWLGKKT